MKKNKIIIVYDGECPFCSDFVSINRLQSLGYFVTIINARDHDNPLVEKLGRNYNLDDGMIVINGDMILYGHAAARFISASYSRLNFKAIIYHSLLSNKTFARFSYGFFVNLRKLYFKIIGKRLINEKN